MTDPTTPLVCRSWRGRTRAADADAYATFLHTVIFPELDQLGSRGAYVLRRDEGETVEFWVLSLWESMEAVRRFAGPEPERAVIPDEARRLLVEFDAGARHYEVLHAPGPPLPPR